MAGNHNRPRNKYSVGRLTGLLHKLSKGRVSMIVIFIVGIVLIVYAGLVLVTRYRETHMSTANLPATGQPTDRPDETKYDVDTTKYVVPDAMPRMIQLPSLGVKGFIQQVNIDAKTNMVTAPSNIHMAGWYSHSSKPGKPGVSLIDGHVQGRYASGIFKDLDKLKSGDPIVIEYGNGDRVHFKVIGSKHYDAEEAGSVMLKTAPGVSVQLNLITCSGAYDTSSQQYEKRLIVVSELL